MFGMRDEATKINELEWRRLV